MVNCPCQPVTLEGILYRNYGLLSRIRTSLSQTSLYGVRMQPEECGYLGMLVAIHVVQYQR